MFLNVTAKATVLSKEPWESWVVNTDMIVYVRPHGEGGYVGTVQGQMIVDDDSYRKILDAVRNV